MAKASTEQRRDRLKGSSNWHRGDTRDLSISVLERQFENFENFKIVEKLYPNDTSIQVKPTSIDSCW